MQFHTDKHDAYGVVTRHKLKLVANGKTQAEGIDFNEPFSPVIKPVSRLHLALSRNWNIKQLDVKNAFLHGTLSETIYMHQLPGFVNKSYPHYVCKLNKVIHGLKQASRAWNARITQHLAKFGFMTSMCDPSLFVYKQGASMAYMLLYVDDIILTGSSNLLLEQIVAFLKTEFLMTYMGESVTSWALRVVNHVLGCLVCIV